jgi:hypothetical protein
MTTLKLQYDNFDTGEFTEEKTVDKQTLLTIFDENTEIVKANRTYSIKRPLIKFYLRKGENYLCIMHFTKDAFKVWYCNDPDTRLFEGNYYKKNVRKLLELFFDNNLVELNKFIPRTTKSEKSLISLFMTSDFLYIYRPKGLIYLALCTLMFLPGVYLFIYLTFISQDKVLAIMTSIFPLIIIFHFILHFNYIKRSKNISIKVSSGSSKVVVYDDKKLYEFSKEDIKEVFQVTGSGFRNPYIGYSFSRIILNDSKIFDISYMIIEPYELKYKLSNVPTKQIARFYPFIKNYCT